MAHPAAHDRPLSVAEYLEMEEVSSVKHEYVAGEVYAMTGTTQRHNQIAGNIFARLWNAARGGPCRVRMSDVKLRAADDVFYYPDVMVTCDPGDTDRLVVHSPCLVVEVTSPSTQTVDRREKIALYKRIPSVRAYLIVDQERRLVDRHWRDAEGAWHHAALLGEGRVPFPCPELTLTLDEIYEGVD
ncbi:MAG TPA: Uma2 family endonuclease [Gemmatimonadaceae bacterium]|nr:Uma2 family endonuclease [Gemmatimonadaceae bacterium]